MSTLEYLMTVFSEAEGPMRSLGALRWFHMMQIIAHLS